MASKDDARLVADDPGSIRSSVGFETGDDAAWRAGPRPTTGEVLSWWVMLLSEALMMRWVYFARVSNSP